MKIINMITENDIQKVQIDKIEEVLRAKLKNLIISHKKYKFYSGDIEIHIDADSQDIKLRYDYKKPQHFTYNTNTVSDTDLAGIAKQFLEDMCKYYSIYSVVLIKKDATKVTYSTCRYDRDDFDFLSYITSEEMIEVSNALYDSDDAENIRSIEIYDENAEKPLCEIKLKEHFLKNRRYFKSRRG